MKKENSILSKKLKQYSAMASAMLAVTSFANAQVIYTDIDPDSVFTGEGPFPGEIHSIDLNNDGTFDFIFKTFHSTYTNGIAFIPYPPNTSNPNAIVGTVQTTNGHPYGYVSALALNDIIDANQPFFNMADLSTNGTGYKVPIMVSGSTGNQAGKWAGGVTDHYIGVKFNFGGSNHYGWIRCDVASDGSSVTVKDYGYEATANTPLFAGQGSPLGVAPVDQKNSFSIFGYEGVANIFINDGIVEGTYVTVMNMLGETLINEGLTDRNTRLDLNQFAKGIYLVTVRRGNEIASRKISFR